MRGERGQAAVELVASLPVLVAIGLTLLQLLSVGYASVLAGAAAEAGALAMASGSDPRAAVKEALPGWSEADARVRVERESVRVVLRPPSPIAAVARRFEVTADAAVVLP